MKAICSVCEKEKDAKKDFYYIKERRHPYCKECMKFYRRCHHKEIKNGYNRAKL